MARRPALQSATKTADKNNGGQVLDPLSTALKISNVGFAFDIGQNK